jgi:hypothetical protein
MRRLIFLSCLTLLLTGPLLRQAEAASDFIRALASVFDSGDTLAEIDGGVGDDKGEMTQKASVSNNGTAAEVSPWDRSATCVCPSSLLLGLPLLAHASDSRRRVRASWPPDGAGPRQAWLQLYLF